MPVGIIVNALSIVLGGLAGTWLGKYLPERMRKSLTIVFGMSAISIGVVLLTGIQNMPAVVLSLILGTMLGEGLDLEGRVASGSAKLKAFIERKSGKAGAEDDVAIEQFVSLLIIMVMGGTGLIGAMTEGITGDRMVLLTKSIMDLFTAVIFASSIGILTVLVAIPQFVVFMLLFLLSGVLYPLLSPAMIADFMGCGGVISILAGIRLMEIKQIRLTNMLPGLVLVMPLSYLWTQIFG